MQGLDWALPFALKQANPYCASSNTYSDAGKVNKLALSITAPIRIILILFTALYNA